MQWLKQSINLWGFPFTITVESLIWYLTSTALYLAGSVFLTILLRRLSARIIENEDKRQHFLKWSRRFIRLTVAFGVLIAFIHLLGFDSFETVRKVYQVLSTPFFSSGKSSISILTLMLILPIVVVASWTGRLAKRSISPNVLTHFGLSVEQQFSFNKLIHYIVMTFVFFFGLTVIGIDLSAIGVLFGTLGIGIGFGLQATIADFCAGLRLLGMGLVKEGDRLHINNLDCFVKHIHLLNTELTTFENESLILPNSMLTGGIIHSSSFRDRHIVIINTVDVSYKSNLDQVISVLRNVAECNPWLLPESEIDVRILSFGDSGITMSLRTWLSDANNRPMAKSWTYLEIWRAFKSEGIEIPFPQRVVHQAKD
ncbi:MAG: hypothetical protein B0D92_05240 [Spirochaeta sp. LUC14_002_19_P3]|nr:MAG: hypothetical protein B0D92_05240 [Spirochaeta sp. LUC14_002_19_P3]